MSRNELFTFGLFFGFTFLLILLIIIMAWEGSLDVDRQQHFKEIFPLFRGAALFLTL